MGFVEICLFLFFSDFSFFWGGGGVGGPGMVGRIYIEKLFSSQWRRDLVSASHTNGRRIGPHPGPHLSQFLFFNSVVLLLFFLIIRLLE